MKNDKEHIDHLFESLNDRQFDIPEAFLEDLNKRLDEKPKKRKYVFLWFLLPLILIGAIGFGYFSYLSEVKSQDKLPVKISSRDGSPENPETPLNPLLSEQLQNSPSPADSVSVLSTGKNKSTTRQQVPAKKQTHSLKKTSKPSDTHRIQWNRQTSKTQKSQVNQFTKIKNTPKKSDTKILKGKQTKGIKPGKNGVHRKTKTGTPEVKTKNEPILGDDKDQKIPNETETVAVSTVAGDVSSALVKESVPKPEKDSAATQNTADSIQHAVPVPSEKDAAKQKAPGNNWKKEIVFFAGIGGNSIQDSPKNSEYLAKIKESQTSILAPSFGINANFSHKKFTFGSGINYEQTGEKFKADMKSTELKDSIYSEFIQDTLWVQDSIGNWIPVPHDTTIYHTVQYTDSVWASKSFQNRYSWISIPLHFGYRFEWGNYELIPRIGAVFNIGIASGTGSYPNASFNNTNRYPPAKLTVSYLIQLEARRNFDRWFVFINPYFRSMINPAVSGDVIRRRYSSWGMQFGIGLNLN